MIFFKSMKGVYMGFLNDITVMFNYELLVGILGIFLVGYFAGFTGAIVALAKRL
mgnify:CR=1 FL=1